jgi:hypothetical protein
MNEQHTFIGTKAASKKLDELLARPGMAAQVAEIRSEMDVEDRRYAASLAAIRHAADTWAAASHAGRQADANVRM